MFVIVLSFDNCRMENTQFRDDNIAVQSSVGETLGGKERDDLTAGLEQKTAAGGPSCNHEERFLNCETAAEHSSSFRTPSPEYSDAVQEQDSMGETVARPKEDGEVSGWGLK